MLHSHSNANILKVRAQWASDAVEQKALVAEIINLTKTPEWKDLIKGFSNPNMKKDLEEEPEIDLSSGLEEEPEIDISAGLEEEINPDNLESISISIERETFDFESNDWHEVARSEPVDAVVFEEDSGAQLKFKWYDQGW